MPFGMVDNWDLDVNGASVLNLSDFLLCCTYLLSVGLDQAVFICNALLGLVYVCLKPIHLCLNGLKNLIIIVSALRVSFPKSLQLIPLVLYLVQILAGFCNILF